MTPLDRADFDFLMENARAGQALGLGCFQHLDQPLGLWNYIRIANAIAARLSSGELLDWGCGLGQMTYLLQRRGLTVTSFDVGPAEATLPDIPLCRSLHIIRSQDPTALPFAAATFDAVLSCGVLEHVEEGTPKGDARGSLCEIARILRPGGVFLLYQLPQRYGWHEPLIRRLHLGYTHPCCYTASEIRGLLAEAGFRVERLRRANLLPKGMVGLPHSVRSLYSRLSHPLIAVDQVLSQLPLLREVAGVMEITAQRIG